MRQFITAAVLALGLIALWAAILPLTAQPAPKPAVASSPAMAKALFLCRGPNGIDKTCAAALAKALVQPPAESAATQGAATPVAATPVAATPASDRHCRFDRQVMASLERH
ncbi:MAG: hypothetical protein WDN25_05165 [Acetobacteraceae bacterium]